MTFAIYGATAAARHPIAHRHPMLWRGLVLGSLLSSVATAALAQAVPGSTNSNQQEQTAVPAPGLTPAAPRADSAASPQSASTVAATGARAPQDDNAAVATS